MARERLPRSRETITHHVTIGDGNSTWLHVGLYPDGRPGEVFITLAKAGSTLRGVTDALARTMSHALQNGVPLDELVDAWIGTNYEPNGMTDDPDVPTCTSLTDYIAKRLIADFLPLKELDHVE